MPKRDAPKSNKGTRNDDRKNGKAYGSGKTRGLNPKLTQIELILLGKGKMQSPNPLGISRSKYAEKQVAK